MLIGVGHQSRSGKDTVVQHIARNNCVVLRFSDTVYDIHDYTQKQLGVERKKTPQLLQIIGDGLRGVHGDYVFVTPVKNKITSLLKSGCENIVVEGVRYLNEATMLKSFGFKIIKVDRQNRLIDRNPNHPSETQLLNYPFDYIIDNNKTIEDLKHNVDVMLGELF